MLYCGASDGCKPVTKDFAHVTYEETSVSGSFGAGSDKAACVKVMAVPESEIVV